jgi:hypothetical protein
MTVNSNRTRLSQVSILSLSTFLAFAWLGTDALILRPVQAAPASTVKCTIITYYSDASLTNQVGTYSNCPTEPPKRGLTGRRTKYTDSSTFDLGDIRGGLHHPNPGNNQKLPCDILPEDERIKKGCGNLPGR